MGERREVGEDWFVVRDKDVLSRINQGFGGKGEEKVINMDKALVRVRIKLVGKGRLGENSLLCVPRKSDLIEEKGSEVISEPQQKDEMEKERKEKRKQHQEKMKRLKRQWKKVKNKKVLMVAQRIAEEKEVDVERMKMTDHSLSIMKGLRDEENSRYKEKAERLWEGECSTVRNSSSREVMGWVVRGGYSYRLGGEVGEGLVTARGWLEWVRMFSQEEERLLLTRETSSLQYRIGRMDLVM